MYELVFILQKVKVKLQVCIDVINTTIAALTGHGDLRSINLGSIYHRRHLYRR